MTKKSWWGVTLCVIGTATLGWGAAAAELPIKGAMVQELSAAWDLRTEIERLSEQRREPFWIGYEVPLVPTMGGLCCLSGSCALERGAEQMLQGTVKDDAPHPDLMVFLRVHQGKVTQIRSFTTDCSLDAGGLPLFWVPNAKPEDSIALLAGVVRPQSFDTMTHAAIYAIGAHADKAADEALKGIVRTARSPEVLAEALTRLGNVRGRAGFEALRSLWEGAESEPMRKQVLVAIAEGREPESEDVLRQVAQEDRSAEIRAWALLKYAEKSRRALPVLSEAIAHDPDPKVRSAAVAALKHLPKENKEEGREILEDLARQSEDPAIRHQAQSLLAWMDGCRPGKPGASAQGCSPR